jgi:hypothetical protein
MKEKVKKSGIRPPNPFKKMLSNRQKIIKYCGGDILITYIRCIIHPVLMASAEIQYP